jgi:hypothetical protein
MLVVGMGEGAAVLVGRLRGGATASRPLRHLISAVFLRGVNMAGSCVRTTLLEESSEAWAVG